MKISNSKTLFVVEGEKTESNLFERSMSILNENFESNIYVFGTDLSKLYQEVSEIGEYFDLLEILRDFVEKKIVNNESKYKSCKIGEEEYNKNYQMLIKQQEIVYSDYEDIYLIFDREPHIEELGEKHLKYLQKAFNNSSNNGLLLLSYPMIESLKDINTLILEEFYNTVESIENFNSNKYKKKKSLLIIKKRGIAYIVLVLGILMFLKLSYICTSKKFSI